ncbi:hypothetical protein JDV02_006640 [Purpureocillium takamizusanense]|nr:uncharacterized protein JDV02_006640 [Purpureocillium takamizusanense]UNI20565.1 hypothetical protein JDV02_006640 [Purpureocillium takamizusanense]
MQRHLKAHKCPYPDCVKGQRGFSTSNDLVRHKRSVHGEHALPGRSFVCPHCNSGSRSPKIWPRADNFRSHLQRAHGIRMSADDDHKEYIYRPPEDKMNLEGVGSFHVTGTERPPYLQGSPVSSDQSTSLDHQFRDEQLISLQESSMGIDPSIFRSPDLVRPTTTSNTDNDNGLVEPIAEAGSLDTQSIGEYDLQTSPGFEMDSPEYDGPAGIGHATDTPAPTLPEPLEKPSPQPERHELSVTRLGPSECTLPGVEDHRADLALPQRCNGGPQFSAIMELFKSKAHGAYRDREEIIRLLTAVPTEDLQTALRARQDAGDTCQSDDDLSTRAGCRDCGKTFSRLCELKKHMKRHQKPYGCTFKQCSKRFGSKNDWKRHESSQHYELETWNCDKPGCKKTCQRRESFKNHLQKDHDVKDTEEIEQLLEKCRMGRHCGPRFWCGFCVDVIEITAIDRGGNSWTKRCDHIDNHLFGKEGLEKYDISKWKHQEDLDDTVRENVDDILAVPDKCTAAGSGAKKRKSSDNIDERPSKKPSYMWQCCICDTTMNLKTSPSCVGCEHVRCATNCMIEQVESSNDEVVAMEVEVEGTAVAGDDMPRT